MYDDRVGLGGIGLHLRLAILHGDGEGSGDIALQVGDDDGLVTCNI